MAKWKEISEMSKAEKSEELIRLMGIENTIRKKAAFLIDVESASTEALDENLRYVRGLEPQIQYSLRSMGFSALGPRDAAYFEAATRQTIYYTEDVDPFSTPDVMAAVFKEKAQQLNDFFNKVQKHKHFDRLALNSVQQGYEVQRALNNDRAFVWQKGLDNFDAYFEELKNNYRENFNIVIDKGNKLSALLREKNKEISERRRALNEEQRVKKAALAKERSQVDVIHKPVQKKPSLEEMRAKELQGLKAYVADLEEKSKSYGGVVERLKHSIHERIDRLKAFNDDVIKQRKDVLDQVRVLSKLVAKLEEQRAILAEKDLAHKYEEKAGNIVKLTQKDWPRRFKNLDPNFPEKDLASFRVKAKTFEVSDTLNDWKRVDRKIFAQAKALEKEIYILEQEIAGLTQYDADIFKEVKRRERAYNSNVRALDTMKNGHHILENELFSLQNKLEAQSQVISSQQEIENRPLSAIRDWYAANNDKIIIVDKALAEAEKSEYVYPQHIYAVLEFLANEYRNVKLSKDFDAAVRDKVRNAYDLALQGLEPDLDTSISSPGKLAKNDRPRYFIDYDGETLFLRNHFKKGNQTDDRYKFRLYFEWSEKQKTCVVGHMPSHLPMLSKV